MQTADTPAAWEQGDARGLWPINDLLERRPSLAPRVADIFAQLLFQLRLIRGPQYSPEHAQTPASPP